MTRRPYHDSPMDERPVEIVQEQARMRLVAAGIGVRTNPRLDAHDHREGVGTCVLCAPHDHSDTTVFGFTITEQTARKAQKDGTRATFSHRLPVLASRFVCPACGNAEAAAMVCNVWTPEGAKFRRENPELFPGQQEMFMADETFETGF